MIAEPHTEELPMTSEMRRVVGASGRYEWLGFAVGGLLVAGAVYGAMAGEGGLAIAAAGLGLLTVAGTELIRRGRKRSLAGGTFTRATGRLAVNYGTEGGSYEFLAGRLVVPIDERAYRALLRVVSEARSADFSTQADILFEVRDAGGRPLWRNSALK